jgi:hypothetical protein
MLAGFPFGSAGMTLLAEVRPDLPRRVIDAVDTLSHYSHDGDTPDIDGFLYVLRSLAGPTTPVRTRIAPPVAHEPEELGGTEEYIVIQRPSFFGRRFVATVAIAAAVVTAAFIILQRGGTSPVSSPPRSTAPDSHRGISRSRNGQRLARRRPGFGEARARSPTTRAFPIGIEFVRRPRDAVPRRRARSTRPSPTSRRRAAPTASAARPTPPINSRASGRRSSRATTTSTRCTSA